MTEMEIQSILKRQREYFAAGHTLPAEARIAALKKLKASLQNHEQDLAHALKTDLGKSATESYMCETGLTLSEATWMIRHVRRLMRERRVPTPLSQFAARSFRSRSPYGNVLIMSPWNYPVLLTLDPLIDAIAAGNTAIVKPSAYAPATAAVLQQIVAECFPPEHVCVITGGRAENQALLHQKFDMIFFTGSKAVGKEVLRCAAEYLTPAVLELGGKSPCIVEKSAKIGLAAKRIVFGKYLNCGQTCVAPDYILCDTSIRDELIAAIQKEITAQFGADPMANEDYGKIINEKHYRRLMGLIDPAKVVCGGTGDEAAQRIAPTVMKDVTREDAVMGEEIFGPILPVLTYTDLDAALADIEAQPHPLALYLFSEDKAVQRKVLDRCHFGGGCLNDVIIHLATSEMPFGGVGESGMGGYHGKYSFDAFSHQKSVLKRLSWPDVALRYAPYGQKLKQLKRLM